MTTNNDFDKKTTILLGLFEVIRKGTEEQFVKALSQLTVDQIDISTKDTGGNSIIFDAITRGYTKAVKLILEFDPRLDVLDTEGYSLLYYPIKQNDMEILSILLAADADSIGASLSDIGDKIKNVPLFYCIKFNNLQAMKILIDHGANVNYRNDSHNTALHAATIRGNIAMMTLLLANDANVNARSNDGSTALQHACNFDNPEAVKILLDHGADPNLTDSTHEFSPLFYAVQNGSVAATKLLVQHHANPNHQDYAGNTVFTYAINSQRFEIIEILISSYPIGKRKLNIYTEDINAQVSCNCIDPNLVNLDGFTLAHLFIYFFHETFIDYLKRILPACNLNYQDNQGNTVLLLLAKYKLWQEFKDILVVKKLNIFIRNNENKMPYSYASDNLFIDMVIQSYANYLRAYPNQWLEQWQNDCVDKDCTEMIRSQILQRKISVPIKANKQQIILDPETIVNFSTFTGSILDVVVGFRYLCNKYPNCYSTFTSYRTMDITYMKQLGIMEAPGKAVMAIEIMWVYQKLFLPPDFNKTIADIIANDYQYIIVPIGIVLSNGAHSNCLFYHVKTRVLERFEPHGAKYPVRLNYNPDLLDNILFKTWNNIISVITGEPTKIDYYTPASYLPKIGFQMLEGREVSVNMNIGDPNGFCSLWCIFYLDYRLRYPTVKPDKLVKELIRYVSVNRLSFRSTIRNYSKRITDLRDSYLVAIGQDINDYMNQRLTVDDLIRLNRDLQKRGR